MEAQVSSWQESRRGALYLGIGYNTYSLSGSALHVYQPSLNNRYDINNFQGQITPPTGSSISGNLAYTAGYFFSYNQRWAIEASYLPFRYYANDLQQVNLNGVLRGVPVDTGITFARSSGNHFYLDKGSALLLFSLVRRFPIFRDKEHKVALDLYGKLGFGPAFIHEDVALDSLKTKPSFSASAGYNIGGAAGARITILRHFFLEFLVRYSTAYLNNIPVYQGNASMHFISVSELLNFGFTFPTNHFNPMFRKGEKPRPKGLPNGPEPRGDIDSTTQPRVQLIENY